MHALGKLELLKAEFARAQMGAPAPADVATPSERSPRGGSAALNTLVIRGSVVVLGFFGFLGAWAAYSPIDSAAIAFSVVGAEGARKAVQHQDGGVVEAILVKEGALVAPGQELIRLDQVQVRATLEIQTAAVDTLTAVTARLEAEASGKNQLVFPAGLTQRAADPEIKALLASQEQLFKARRATIAAQITTIGSQIKQTSSQVEIYRNQVETASKQYAQINDELGPKEEMLEKGFSRNSEVMPLRRAATALSGQINEGKAQIGRLEHTIEQLSSQINQAQSDYRLKTATELEDARNKLADALERRRVGADILERTVIRAPNAGYVLGLSVNTVGAVIAKGERLLEIVPADAGVSIKARLRPADGIEVQPGMRAEIRILSAQGRRLPSVEGTVRTRSADARPDPATQALFFDADIVVAPDKLAELGEVKLLPGTPVEVIIPTGSRTVLQYIIEPISESFRHGLREK